MSYDLMVFHKESAPQNRTDFISWFEKQTKWEEDHSYDDPGISSLELKSWFIEMIKTFPAMNGPYSSDKESEYITDYCIGKEVIYITFNWSLAEEAYIHTKSLAEKYKVGFFDVSANEGDILFPGSNGLLHPIDKPDNLSSIDQIKALDPEGKKVLKKFYSKISVKISKSGITSASTRQRIRIRLFTIFSVDHFVSANLFKVFLLN